MKNKKASREVFLNHTCTTKFLFLELCLFNRKIPKYFSSYLFFIYFWFLDNTWDL